MFLSISEHDIHEAVRAVRAQIQDKYDWAMRYQRHDWLSPISGYDKMMTKCQIHMGEVFPGKKRELRLEVTQVLLGVEGLEITSFKDLFPSEISSIISAFEEIPKFRLILDALATNLAHWEKVLGKTLKRPSIPVPEAPPEDTWEEETYTQPAIEGMVTW